jgi:hypothetical protein
MDRISTFSWCYWFVNSGVFIKYLIYILYIGLLKEIIMEFVSFGKIPRLSKECIITEKLDGTNAQIYIAPFFDLEYNLKFCLYQNADFVIYAGSRTRWITPTDDNAGFSKWVFDHAEELLQLGYGHHFGEWWGQKIGRTYGLTERRFSLFNASRWSDDEVRPSCCHVVPTLYSGDFCTNTIDRIMKMLEEFGSLASPGFMKPEGCIIYHTAAKQYFKKTFESLSKWELEQRGK